MKLYYICEYCREIYENHEVEGPDGTAEITGACQDCLAELGLTGESQITSLGPLYH